MLKFQIVKHRLKHQSLVRICVLVILILQAFQLDEISRDRISFSKSEMWFKFGLKVFYSTQGSVRRDESTWDGPCPSSSYGSLIQLPMVDYHTLPRRIIQKSMNKYRFWISFVPQARSFFTLNYFRSQISGDIWSTLWGQFWVKIYLAALIWCSQVANEVESSSAA